MKFWVDISNSCSKRVKRDWVPMTACKIMRVKDSFKYGGNTAKQIWGRKKKLVK